MNTYTGTPQIFKRFFKQVHRVPVAVGEAFVRRFQLAESSAASPGVVVVERELSKRAFTLWEQAGHPDGREWDYWDQAETEFAAESRPPCHRQNFQTLRSRNQQI